MEIVKRLGRPPGPPNPKVTLTLSIPVHTYHILMDEKDTETTRNAYLLDLLIKGFRAVTAKQAETP